MTIIIQQWFPPDAKKKKKKNESIVASQKVHTFTLGKLLATGMCQTDAVIRAKIKGKTT